MRTALAAEPQLVPPFRQRAGAARPRCAYCAAARWFHFRVSGARGQALTLRIVNAAKSSFPEARLWCLLLRAND